MNPFEIFVSLVYGTFSRMKASKWLVLSLLSTIILPLPAFAIQLHGDPEGLYGHQIAHLFFVASMGMLIYWLLRMKLIFRRGWRFIALAAVCLIMWNLDAFVGHAIEGSDGVGLMVEGGWIKGKVRFSALSDTMAILYYLIKLDHLLCVPAVVSMFIGLRELHSSP
jgi:hypothetical protein